MVTFEFSTNGEPAELQGIAFSPLDNNQPARSRTFRLAGSQRYGLTQFRYEGGIQTFSIPVGEFLTGSELGFVIANDNDFGDQTNEVTLNNVRISN